MCQDREVVAHEVSVPLRINASCSLGSIFVIRSVQVKRVGCEGRPKAGDRASLKSQDFSAGMNRCPKKKPAMNDFVRNPEMAWVRVE